MDLPSWLIGFLVFILFFLLGIFDKLWKKLESHGWPKIFNDPFWGTILTFLTTFLMGESAFVGLYFLLKEMDMLGYQRGSTFAVVLTLLAASLAMAVAWMRRVDLTKEASDANRKRP